MPDRKETLAETIEETTIRAVVQDQSRHAGSFYRDGVCIAEISVAALMDQLGVDALPVGNYVLTGDNDLLDGYVGVPNGAILTASPIVDVHEAKAGSGTIAIQIQDLDGDWIAFDTAINTVTVDGSDDAAGNVLVAGYKWTQNARMRIVVSTATVTAGAATVRIPYFLGLTD